MARGGTHCCLLSDLSYLSTHQDGSCLFIARGATLCSLLAVYLNYQQITNQDGSCLFIARDWILSLFALNKRVALLSREARILLSYFGCECNLPIQNGVASLWRKAGPLAVCSPTYLIYQHIKMGVASLSREARPFAVCSPFILTINKSQIKMGVASLLREAGTFLVLALKVARGFPFYRKRRRQLTTTCYLCYQHVIPPYCPRVFKTFPKKEGPPPPGQIARNSIYLMPY